MEYNLAPLQRVALESYFNSPIAVERNFYLCTHDCALLNNILLPEIPQKKKFYDLQINAARVSFNAHLFGDIFYLEYFPFKRETWRQKSKDSFTLFFFDKPC